MPSKLASDPSPLPDRVPTIRDVAERAGVSAATVSRVLNKSASVVEAKRVRVEEAAEALGYHPNPNALQLLGQRTGGIGVLLPYIAGDFFSSFLLPIDRHTSDTGEFLMVTSSHHSAEEFKTVFRALDRRVDGLIVMSTDVPAQRVLEWLRPSVPLVFVNTDIGGVEEEAESINFDNRGGAALVAEHFIAQGHRRLAFLAGPPESHDGIERRAGFARVLASHGLEIALEIPGDYTYEAGEAAAAAFLEASPRPTAIFAANDLSACGLLSALSEAGVDVPGEVALAGFDDVPLSRLTRPTLTTIRVPLAEIGRRAIERLTERIEGAPLVPGETVLPTSLVVRDSTARA